MKLCGAYVTGIPKGDTHINIRNQTEKPEAVTNRGRRNKTGFELFEFKITILPGVNKALHLSIYRFDDCFCGEQMFSR